MISAFLLSAMLAVGAPAQVSKPAPQTACDGPKAADAFPGLSETMTGLKSGLDPRADAGHLFAVEEHDGKFALILKQNQLERSYLMNASVEQGTGERGVYSAMQEDSFLFTFHWAGGKIQVLRKDTSHRAQAGTPEEKAVAQSFPPSVIATLPVISSGSAGDGPFAVPADELFLEDMLDIAGKLKQAYPGSEDLRQVPPESTVESVRSLASNLDARAQLMFARSQQKGSELPDSRRIAIRVAYSVSELPADGFETRTADPRVGYFQTEYRDYSRSDLKDRLDPYVRLANRWRLEKKEPDAPVSEPKKPITYWIDETVPDQYRPAIKAGILAWNAAFEAAGFRNAIVVKEVDKDMSAKERATFDPSSAAYNMVRWFMGNNAGFAIGPSRANPLTGEIYNASISVSDEMARFFADESQLVPVKTAAPKGGHNDESYMERSAIEARSALALLQGRGDLSPEERERFKQEYLAHVIAHEVGHTLGLRHNFKGSTMLGEGDLGKDGLVTGSLMDYVPANIAASGKAQGRYFQTKIGPYDQWAIEYGYKPVPADSAAKASTLSGIAARSIKDPSLAYATDEDAGGSDPDSQRFDLGKDPIAYAKNRTALAKGLWQTLEGDTQNTGDELRGRFLTGFSAYVGGVDAVIPVIGGVRTSRQPTGDAFAPVSAAEQRRALAFLNEAVFSGKPISPSPELVRRMGRDRTAEGRPSGPLPVDAMTSGMQEGVLGEILSASTLNRLAQRSSMVSDPKDSFGARDLLSSVQSAVWKEIQGAAPSSITAPRRELQRKDAEIVVRLLSDESVPGDARAAVRGELTSLSGRIDRALKSKTLDRDTRLHLKDVQKTIQKAVDDGSDS
ncbi:MAG: zinc-dependent metalloprotease [Elusimicrobia bacterium]|nr:zinc-dependent metalloprotease [Elusimicrobiota bacterium]